MDNTHMILSANEPDDKSFSTVIVHGFTLRISEDGKQVELQTLVGWHDLEQIPDKWRRGYLRVRLPSGKTVSVHKVVALAWHGPAPSPEHVLVEHIDGSRRNNHRENVRWATHSDNLNSAFRLRERERKYAIKLHAAIVYEIRTRRQRCEIADLASELGAGDQTIRDVFDNHTWRHVRLDAPPIPDTY